MKKRVLFMGCSVFMLLALVSCKEKGSLEQITMQNDIKTEAVDTETSEPITTAEVSVTEMEVTEETDIVNDTTEDENADVNEDSGFYSVSTSLSSTEVESFAKMIRQNVLDKNWEAIADYISYPRTIGSVVCQNRDDFIKAEFESELSDTFFKDIENETCVEMFNNWQGIRLGEQGEIWIGSVRNDEDVSELKIIGINPID